MEMAHSMKNPLEIYIFYTVQGRNITNENGSFNKESFGNIHILYRSRQKHYSRDIFVSDWIKSSGPKICFFLNPDIWGASNVGTTQNVCGCFGRKSISLHKSNAPLQI